MTTLTLKIDAVTIEITITGAVKAAPVFVPTEQAMTVHADLSRSSFIEGATYHPTTRTVDVRLKSGKAYRYFKVEDYVFDSFIKSDSPGTFYNCDFKYLYTCQELKR